MNPRFRNFARTGFFGALVLCLTFEEAATATDILWNGALTGTLDWNTGGNWSGGSAVNSSADRADLRVDWGTSPVINLSAAVVANGILFDDTGTGSDSSLTIGNGGTAANTLTLAGTTPTMAVSSTTVTLSANLEGSGGFTKTNGGTLILSGTNSNFSGTVFVDGGILQLGGTSALNLGSIVQVNSGGTFRVNNSNTIAGLNDNAGAGGSVTNGSGGGKVLTLAGSGTYSFAGNFTGNPTNLNGTKVGLLVSGTGTQTLGGSNLTNGGYQSVTGGGTLVFAQQNSIFQGLSTGAVVNNNSAANPGISVSSGGTVALAVGDSVNGYFDAAAIGTFLDVTHMGASTNSTGFRNNSILGFDTTKATGGTFTYSTALANIGTSTGIGFAKLGAGTLILDAANTYGGVTQVRAGTLQIGSGGTAGTLGSGEVTISSGATLAFNRSDTALSVANKITGAGSVSQNGTGTTTFTASTSDYSGGTSINGGILVARVGSIGGGDVSINSGGKQFKLSNSDFSISNDITIASGAVGVSGQGVIDTDTNVDAVLNGDITISGTPTVTGAGHFGSSSGGSLTVNGSITSSVAVEWRRNHGVFSNGGTGYTNFKIRAGDVKLGGNNGLATTATVALGGDGAAILDLAGYNQSLVGITKGANAATITNSGASDSLLTITGTSAYDGVIQDGATNKVALKVDGGQLTLTGTNGYSGATNVSAGKLIVDGSISNSHTTIGSTGALGGSGSTGGISVQAGGTLAPGASIGSLTASGAVGFAAGSILEIEIDTATAYDQLGINSGGGLNVTSGAKLSLVDFGSPDLIAMFSRLELIDYSGGTWNGGLFTFGSEELSDGESFAWQTKTWRINYDDTLVLNGNDSSFTNGGTFVTLTAVPEPSFALLAAGGVIALCRRRRL